MAFPSTLSTFNRPNATDRLNSPSHSALHNTVSSALGQVEAVIGVDGVNSILGTVIGDLRSPGSNGGGHVQTAAKGGTGQTTFTKGDILVASSSSILSKLSVGGDNAFLKANSSMATGLQWVGIAGIPTPRVYSAASILTWVKPSVLSYIVVEVVGGGGGGGGISTTGSGGGGGGGGFSRKVINASMLGATETVTVASSALGGGQTLIGTTGRNSSFTYSSGTASILCVGGSPGAGGTSGRGAPGAGGVASGGDWNRNGDNGGFGVAGSFGGPGGGTPFGTGGISPTGTGTGGNGSAGGGGSGANQTGNGGDGAPGQVIIYEF